jgi:hypothetical protein
MLLQTALKERLEDMDRFAKTSAVEPFDLYLIGGSALVLGDHIDRATRDFDCIDLNYSASLGKFFRLLGSFDFLDYSQMILAPDYQKRAKRLAFINYLNIYILALEDIIVSKIIRFSQKDQEDIDQLMGHADTILINSIIDKVLARDDLLENKKEGFKKKMKIFKEHYNV